MIYGEELYIFIGRQRMHFIDQCRSDAGLNHWDDHIDVFFFDTGPQHGVHTGNGTLCFNGIRR